MLALWLLIYVLVITECCGQNVFTCMSSKDADLVNSKSKDLEEKVNSLEMQVRQLQKLVKKHHNSHYSTIEGVPRGNLLLNYLTILVRL